MKNIFFLLFVLTVELFSQIETGKFAKIGFNDMYAKSKSFGPSIPPHFATNSFYYPKLKELGLNYVTTFADDIPFTVYTNDSLKIIDMNLQYGLNANNRSLLPFGYALSTGNSYNKFPYEVGSNTRAMVWDSNPLVDNLGFGINNGDLNSRYSFWVIEDGVIGNRNFADIENRRVAYANIAQHDTGKILIAKIDPTHQPNYDLSGYYAPNWVFEDTLVIQCRIDDTGGSPNDTVAEVCIWEKTYSTKAPSRNIQNNLRIKPQMLNMPATLTPFSLKFYIKANQFNGNNYTDIKSPGFIKVNNQDADIWVTVKWLKKRNLYIDKFYCYDKNYYSLFLNPNTSALQDTLRKIKADIKNLTPNSSNSRYAHLYIDEPISSMHRAYKKISDLAEDTLGNGKFLNGANGPDFDFHYKLVNALRRDTTGHNLKYFMADYYPFSAYVDSNSVSSFQGALDSLIRVSYYWGGLLNHYYYTGLRTAIESSQNFNNELGAFYINDDVPFYQTIQVCAERIQEEGVITFEKRAPSGSEILVQGWLALCYGAKGIMYYNIYTSTPAVNPRNRYNYSVWGLFDDDPLTQYPYRVWQNQENTQYTNKRFDAVKKLNSQIDKISTEVMNLTWKNGYSIAKQTPSGEVIDSIRSFTGTNYDATNNTFVELGMFKKTTDYSNSNLDYFILVNRRCLSSEGRTISFKINKNASDRMLLTEVGSNNSWVITGNATFSSYFEPGTGKLYRLEKIGNGTHIKGNVIIYPELTIPSNTTVYVDTNAVISIPNNTSIIVNGTLSAIGTAAKRINFDFSPINYDIQNGIIVNTGGSLSLNYCTVKNAYYGVKCSGYLLSMSNDSLKYNMNGLYLSSPQYTPQIANNAFSNNNICGVWLYGASPDLYHNNILYNGSAGIFSYSNSCPDISYNNITDNSQGVFSSYYSPSFLYNESTSSGHNLVRNNGTGLYCDHHSNVAAIYNSIYFNSYAIEAIDTSVIYAPNNYWQVANPSFNILNNSSIDWSNPLTTDPLGGGMNKAVASPNNLVGTGNEANGVTNDLLKDAVLDSALHLQIKGKYDEAIKIYEKIVKSEIKTEKGIYALIRMNECYTKAKKDGFDSFLSTNIKPNITAKDKVSLVALELSNHSLIKNRNYENALLNLSKIITDYQDYSSSVKHALFNIGYINVEYMNNLEKAKEAFSVLEQKYPKDFLVYLSKLLMTKFDKNSSYKLNDGNNQDVNSKDNQIPKEYALEQNYPNPFNPTTNIKYSVSADSHVKLKIYDILGKEITTLVNEQKAPGYYTVQFDASKLASGIYFYRMEAGQFVQSKKLLLVK